MVSKGCLTSCGAVTPVAREPSPRRDSAARRHIHPRGERQGEGPMKSSSNAVPFFRAGASTRHALAHLRLFFNIQGVSHVLLTRVAERLHMSQAAFILCYVPRHSVQISLAEPRQSATLTTGSRVWGPCRDSTHSCHMLSPGSSSTPESDSQGSAERCAPTNSHRPLRSEETSRCRSPRTPSQGPCLRAPTDFASCGNEGHWPTQNSPMCLLVETPFQVEGLQVETPPPGRGLQVEIPLQAEGLQVEKSLQAEACRWKHPHQVEGFQVEISLQAEASRWKSPSRQRPAGGKVPTR